MIPKLVVTAALMVAQMALTMTRKIKGPRLDELKVSVADYGTPLIRFWGIRRIECILPWAEDLREEKTSTKTKSGKYEGYKYYATFAAFVADQQIDDITRIWMDRRLVYDKTKAGPKSLASVSGFDVDSGMRVYLGTEDQEPDPAYVAWCEDRYGADSAPAYRGVSYIVFEDLPVEDFGNRIPQVSVEAVSVKTATHPFETRTTGISGSSATWAFNGGWGVRSGSSGRLEWWDIASRTNLGLSPSAGWATGSAAPAALASDGTAYQVGFSLSSGDKELSVTPPLGVPVITATDAPTLGFEKTIVLDGDTRHVYTIYDSHTGYLDLATHIAHTQSLRDACLDAEGNVAKLFQPTGTSSDFTIECAAGTFTITGSAAARSGPTSAYICYSTFDTFAVISDGYFYAIDPTDGTVVNSTAFSGTPQFFENNPSRSTFWRPDQFNEYSLEDGSLVQDLTKSDWTGSPSSDSVGDFFFEPITDAIWSESSGSGVIRYLDRITGGGVTLQTIVDTVCDWCGLTGADTTALTQVVTGYSVTQGSGKDMIDPLLTIHDVDARPHDFQVQFVNRGSAPSGTILTSDFVREGTDTRYKVTIRQDTDLPKKVTFNFADVDKDQQTNTAIAQRPLDAVDSQREETIDLSTYVTDVDEAQQLADRYFRRVWNSREQVENAVTAQKLGLEPGDVTTISLDGAVRNVRLDKMTIAGGRLNCTFVRDETSFAAKNDATTGAPMDGRDDETITIPPPVKGFVIDAPLSEDADNDVSPLLYTTAGTYTGLSFMGAAIFRGDDGTYDELFDTVSTGATWGMCNGVLSDANPWLWDRGNELNVSLQSGTLTSVTEADIDADPSLNLILVGSESGWEYINFTTATLEAAGTYTLSGFKRGRRGTEWMTGEHGSNESWLLASSLSSDVMGVSEVGGAMSFKAQSVGRTIDSASAIDFTYTGATLKPYAPARVKWTTDGTDMFGEIVRRTRVGGAWVGGSTIPLSENSEEYEVDILDGSGNVLRTITVSGTNTFTYTNAQITADGGAVGVPPSFNAYQLSDAVGRGFALAA